MILLDVSVLKVSVDSPSNSNALSFIHDKNIQQIRYNECNLTY